MRQRICSVCGGGQHYNLTASTEARRIAEAMTSHSHAGNAGRWASFRMSDGREVQSRAAYMSRIEAVRFARNDRDTTVYLEITPDGMPNADAQDVLCYARFLHSRGWRLPDPEFDFDGGMPAFGWDRAAMARQLVGGKPV